MGAEASTQVFHQVDGGRFHRASARARKSLVDHWQKRELVSQLFGVVRHAERADGIYAYFNGDRWSATDDSVRWPLDPPLSDAGLDDAKDLGKQIKGFTVSKNGQFHVVITSPYARCVQTAVAICKELGPDVRLLVDLSLGEVYGPEVLGDSQPQNHLRSLDAIARYCMMESVKCVFRPIGRQPAWPETLRDARRRFAIRFIAYLKRGQITRRNFILVTHADCLGAVLGIMPDKQDFHIEKVEYGAALLAHRPTAAQPVSQKLARSNTNDLASVLPASAAQEASDIEDLQYLPDLPEDQVPEGIALIREDRTHIVEDSLDLQVQRCRTDTTKDKKGEGFDGSEKVMSRWTCETFNISLNKKSEKLKPKLSKRIAELIKFGPYSKKQVEQLLGEMKQETLGDSNSALRTSSTDAGLRSSGRRQSTNTLSNISLSTYLFGLNGDRDASVDDVSPVASLSSLMNLPSGDILVRDMSDSSRRSSSGFLMPPPDGNLRHRRRPSDTRRRKTNDILPQIGGHTLSIPLSPLPHRSITEGASLAIRTRRRNSLPGTARINSTSQGCVNLLRLRRFSQCLPNEVNSDEDRDTFNGLCQNGSLLMKIAALKEQEKCFHENSDEEEEAAAIERQASTKESIRRKAHLEQSEEASLIQRPKIVQDTLAVEQPIILNYSRPACKEEPTVQNIELHKVGAPAESPLFKSLNKAAASSLLERRRAAATLKLQPLASEAPADVALLN